MKVLDVARKLAVSPDTVRHYTRIGILRPERQDNGYNAYSLDDLRRLRFAIHAKQLGFSLADIKTILQLSDHGEVPCPLAREVIERNLDKLRQSIEESQRLFRRMEKAVSAWENMADQEPDGHAICRLIEDWSESL
jgi:DNA-binding transcriptional MerR regulator